MARRDEQRVVDAGERWGVGEVQQLQVLHGQAGPGRDGEDVDALGGSLDADAAPQAEAAQEESQDAEPVEDGASTEDDAAEGTAAQAADRDCPDFDSQEEAQDFFEDNGGSPDNNVDELDADGDGEACEDLDSSVADDEGDDEVAPRGGVDSAGSSWH